MKKIISFISAAAVLAAVSCQRPVEAELQAAFENDKTEVMVGEEVSFKDLSTGSVTRWTWKFQGATPETSVLTQPTVCWMDAGTFSVTLTVGNGTKEASTTKEDLIKVKYHTVVTANFEISKTRAYSDEPIKFTNLSTGFPNNIKWTFTPEEGTPVTSTEKDPELTFAPGLYTVKLEVSNPIASDVKELEDALLILDPYAVTAHITSPNATTYTGGTIGFVADIQGPVKTYEWAFEGGTPATSNEANPSVKYTTPGSYKVTLTVSNDKSSDTEEIDGYVHVVPGENLAVLLPFDGDLKDYGPFGVHPSVLGKGDLAITFEEGNGHAQSARFPGGVKGSAYAVLYMPDALADRVPEGNNITVSWWSKTPAVGANQAIFAQGECPGFPASNQIWCRFQTSKAIRCTAEKTGATGNTSTISNTNLQDDEWHNITVVYGNKGKDLVFYFDGVAQTPQNNKGEKDTPILPYCIGCNLRWTNNAPAPENMYEGLLDDYLIYNKAMTADQVKVLYEVGKPTK